MKVQFPWDRAGHRDESSSVWMRVAQPWSSGTSFFLPRVGQEVIVDFLEGDPDRPIVVGRVFNASDMPPCALPAHKAGCN